jgi:hypothetical protein
MAADHFFLSPSPSTKKFCKELAEGYDTDTLIRQPSTPTTGKEHDSLAGLLFSPSGFMKSEPDEDDQRLIQHRLQAIAQQQLLQQEEQQLGAQRQYQQQEQEQQQPTQVAQHYQQQQERAEEHYQGQKDESMMEILVTSLQNLEIQLSLGLAEMTQTMKHVQAIMSLFPEVRSRSAPGPIRSRTTHRRTASAFSEAAATTATQAAAAARYYRIVKSEDAADHDVADLRFDAKEGIVLGATSGGSGGKLQKRRTRRQADSQESRAAKANDGLFIKLKTGPRLTDYFCRVIFSTFTNIDRRAKRTGTADVFTVMNEDMLCAMRLPLFEQCFVKSREFTVFLMLASMVEILYYCAATEKGLEAIVSNAANRMRQYLNYKYEARFVHGKGVRKNNDAVLQKKVELLLDIVEAAERGQVHDRLSFLHFFVQSAYAQNPFHVDTAYSDLRNKNIMKILCFLSALLAGHHNTPNLLDVLPRTMQDFANIQHAAFSDLESRENAILIYLSS